ncbi:unnamed protein product [Lathyrus sativus]|nr:unnamed protein product [Lathyrus sativus]
MESMQMNKGKYRKWLFRCFKTVVDEDDDFKPSRRRYRNATIVTDPVLAYLAAADADGMVLISTTAMEECGNRRRKGGSDTWHSLKMALHETSLMKRIQSRRKTKKSSITRSKSDTTFDAPETPQEVNISNTSSDIANLSEIFSSLQSQGSTTSSNTDYASNTPSHETNIIPKPPPLNGTNGVPKKNNIDNIDEEKRKRNIALCIVWIFSLFVLILWGKLFAILCTSIWLYIVPSKQRRECKEVSLYRESDFDSLRYKKKIIMEGILERTHTRAVLLTAKSS